jgi:hypothetical protein
MIRRRALLAVLLAAPLRGGDPAREVWDVLASMAAALGEGDAAQFLRSVDSEMPGYQDLRVAVYGLVRQVEVESAIEPAQNNGDDRRRTLEVDWQLHLIDRADLQHLTERRAAVKCVFEKQGAKWKLVSFAPRDFFAPPSAHVELAHQR